MVLLVSASGRLEIFPEDIRDAMLLERLAGRGDVVPFRVRREEGGVVLVAEEAERGE